MRDDVRNLLGQIGQADFPYREFDEQDDREELRQWPLLRALAQHPALRRMRPSQPRTSDADTAVPHDRRDPVASGIFQRFEPTDRRAAAPSGQAGEDVRSLLRRLSEQPR